MKTLPVSVVVVARNAEGTVERCLDSVTEQSPAEIIVVDGNSADRTVELAMKYSSRTHSDGGLGLGVARRIGAQQARETYIAYVDADVSLPPGTLETLLEELETYELDGVAAQIHPGSTASYWQCASQQHTDLLQREGRIHLMATLLTREVALSVDFDPFIRGGEDEDFTRRAGQMGYNIRLSTRSYVYHTSPATFVGLVARLWRYGDDIPRWAWKHGILRPRHWPILTAVYRVAFSLATFRMNLVPYFVLAGVVQSAAATWGMLQLLFMRESSERLPPIRWL